MHTSVMFRWALAGFLAGVLAASFALFHPAVPWLMFGVGCLALLSPRPRDVLLGLILVAAAMGVGRTMSSIERPSVLRELAADSPVVTIEGFVDGNFELTARGGKWPLRVLRVRTAQGVHVVDDRVIVYGLDWVRPLQGQALALTGKLQPPTNSGDFDYISYLAKDGIHAQMYFPEYGVPAGELAVPWTVRIRRPLWSVRDAVGGALLRAVPGQEGAYLGGIILGTRGALEPTLKDSFSRTGTSHILAISGYNITIIAGVLMTLLATFGRTRSYWLTVAGIIAFTLMVGASASVVRASVMGILALTAVYHGRKADGGGTVLLAAALMAAANPLLVRWDVGFQLSFLAVVGIIWVEPIIRPLLMRFLYEPLARLTATTLAAQVMVLPLILYDFGTLAVYTLPVNLAVLPLVPLAMALGLATGVIGLAFPFVGSLIGQVAWLVAALQLLIITKAATLPYAALGIRLPVTAMLALYAGIAAWLVSWYTSAVEPSLSREKKDDPRRVVRDSVGHPDRHRHQHPVQR